MQFLVADGKCTVKVEYYNMLALLDDQPPIATMFTHILQQNLQIETTT